VENSRSEWPNLTGARQAGSARFSNNQFDYISEPTDLHFVEVSQNGNEVSNSDAKYAFDKFLEALSEAQVPAK
jgi:hypothetical protein